MVLFCMWGLKEESLNSIGSGMGYWHWEIVLLVFSCCVLSDCSGNIFFLANTYETTTIIARWRSFGLLAQDHLSQKSRHVWHGCGQSQPTVLIPKKLRMISTRTRDFRMVAVVWTSRSVWKQKLNAKWVHWCIHASQLFCSFVSSRNCE